MAVDSRRKRESLIGYGLPFRISLPLADGSISFGDRQHLAGLYALETVPVVQVTICGTLWLADTYLGLASLEATYGGKTSVLDTYSGLAAFRECGCDE